MKVEIENRQNFLKISKRIISSQVIAILIHEKIICDEVAIYFVEDKEISLLHKKFFHDPSPTDTISIPYDKPSDSSSGYCFLGEVFVSTQTAKRYAEIHNIPIFLETTLYMIHGLLHLIGYNDISTKDRLIMRKKEKSCMNLLKKKNLLLVEKWI